MKAASRKAPRKFFPCNTDEREKAFYKTKH